MIFDFGPVEQYIQITAQYSNAVLLAVLPYFSDVAKRAELPVQVPIPPAAVQSVFINPITSDLRCTVVLTNDYGFSFGSGVVETFSTPASYRMHGALGDTARFLGPMRMTQEEAVQLARRTIRKLGYPLEAVYADLEPKVELHHWWDTNVIPYYEIRWLDPRGGGPSADIEVNGNFKRVESVRFTCRNLDRPPPKLGAAPSQLPDHHPLIKAFEPHLNPAYGRALLPFVLRSVDECTRRFTLPLPLPLTTNSVSVFSCVDNGGWPHAKLELTNGYRFIYRNSQLNGFYAPDDFYGVVSGERQRKMLIKDFMGTWNLNDKQIVSLARSAVAKLGYTNAFVHTEGEPELRKPVLTGKPIIPRCVVEWSYPNPQELQQWIRVEVDADKKTIKSVYFDDKSFWRHTPPIDLPISLPLARTTNQARLTR